MHIKFKLTSSVKFHSERSFIKGREEGREEGREDGMKIGKAQGQEEEKLETVHAMLKKNYDISEISEITKLPENKIKAIQNQLLSV